ncbi:16S rRNA (adenine(1518)-N(6)/adenine(1519)-N(6))-dimethyltransferase RsmA [candidate division KSB1 bacterium]|nr:16S rRNA (adenine(1518)-N(6)/adenine(1519)-N(6))-dimethyltransferase RsmA [candidate division KSB1 bacterium]
MPARINVRPKKSLGQNFLMDANIARKIVGRLDLQPTDVIIEIGPGQGALTRLIRPEVQTYLAVELDNLLAARLQREYELDADFHLLHADFLKIDFASCLPAGAKAKVVGNIPYHLTSSVIFKVLKQRHFFQRMTLMIQAEVAARIVAAPGSKVYGILSVLSQTFATPQFLFTVSPHVFYPKPKVTSAMVQWIFDREVDSTPAEDAGFIQMTKNIFQSRRKMLRYNLKRFYAPVVPELEKNWDLTRRAESLSIAEFWQLWQTISGKITSEANFPADFKIAE